MGMEKARWRADLPKVGWKFVILEGNRYRPGVVVNVVRAVRRFLLVERASSQHSRSIGRGRKGGQEVRKSEVVGIKGEMDVLQDAGHVRVVCRVEHGRMRQTG